MKTTHTITWRHRLDVRLLACFVSVLAVFTLAAVLSYRSRRDLQVALQEARERCDGIRASLNMANAAREAYVHVAHVIIDRQGLDHAEHVEEAERELDRWKAEVASKLVSDGERASFRDVEDSAKRFHEIFRREILPAVRAGEHERVHAAHDELERTVTALLAANDRLSERFRARIDETFAQSTEAAGEASRRDILFLGAATLLALVLGLGVARRILGLVGMLLEATRRISRGELGHQVEITDRGELGALARGLNAMSRELEATKNTIVHAEKLASIGRVAAGVAHELNNPLGVMLGYVVTLRKEATRESQLEDDLATVEEEVRHCQEIVQGLLELARPIAIEKEVVDLAALARHELGRLDTRALGKVKVSDELPPELAVHGDAGRLRQVLSNLFRNAMEAMPSGGTLGLRVVAAESESGIALEIADTGPGVSPENLGRIFEPFFTTKKRGIGLGLSISYGIVRAHGGDLRVASGSSEGARFTLELPRATAVAAESS